MQIPPAPEGWSLLLLLNTSSRRRGRGNVVIPKGFPKSGEVVKADFRLYGDLFARAAKKRLEGCICYGKPSGRDPADIR